MNKFKKLWNKFLYERHYTAFGMFLIYLWVLVSLFNPETDYLSSLGVRAFIIVAWSYRLFFCEDKFFNLNEEEKSIKEYRKGYNQCLRDYKIPNEFGQLSL